MSLQRMFEALLDPRSIQWMLTLGGGLCVLGLIVWLTSLGVFENQLVLAVVLGAGSLAVLAMVLMALGLVSIHVERAFAPGGEPFTRQRFGLPFFWSGHAQIGTALLVLLGTQILGWLTGLDASRRLPGISWEGNLLTEQYLVASGLWLAAVYAYRYSDWIVRRIGVYTCLAAFSLVMAEATIAGHWLQEEGWIAVLAVTALVVNLTYLFGTGADERIRRVLPPLSTVLGVLPVLIGLFLHIRATSAYFAAIQWQIDTGSAFVVVMLLVAFSNRMSAWLFEEPSPRW